MDKFFIGIDVSKDSFDICMLDSEHSVTLKHEVFENEKSGVAKFIKVLGPYLEEGVWVCLEHTGSYGALIVKELLDKGIKLSLANPLDVKRSMGVVRGKDDKVDAYRIASYLLRNAFKLKPYQAKHETLEKLKLKLSLRSFYVKMLVQSKNNLKGILVLAKSQDVTEEIGLLESTIHEHESCVQKIERQIEHIIETDTELSTTFKKITRIDGVGFVTAAMCISATANFTWFNNPRKFSCHAGLAPFKYESGSSVKGRDRISRLRNAQLKSLLIRAGMTAAIHDPQLKAYKKRKLEEGKAKMVVNVALANKLTARIFAVALRDEPYVKLAA